MMSVKVMVMTNIVRRASRASKTSTCFVVRA
jgi:hypothetical protein